jgi:amino acid permease
MLFVALPLVLLRKVSSLRFTGFLSIMYVCFFTITLLVRSIEGGVLHGTDSPEAANTTFTQFFRGLTIMAYAFSIQTAVFPVYHEMHTRTAATFHKVSLWTSTVSFSIYGVAGVSVRC